MQTKNLVSDLEASIDRVGRQAGLLGADLPLLEDLILNLLDTTQELVGGDGLVGDTEDRQGRVVVLVLLTV